MSTEQITRDLARKAASDVTDAIIRTMALAETKEMAAIIALVAMTKATGLAGIALLATGSVNEVTTRLITEKARLIAREIGK